MSKSFLLASACFVMAAAGPALADEAADKSSDKTVSELVVTAAPYAVSVDSATTSVNILKREDLDTGPPGGLGDALAGVPGLRSTFFGPGASRPVIRGMSGPRVMVLTNGVGMIDASGLSPDHQVASDPQEAERVEVLRGPSALAYGGSAIGGVVNIIDDRIPDTYSAGAHGRAMVSANSGDDGREASGQLRAGVGDKWMLTLDGVHRTSEDYRVPVDPISSRLAAEEGLPAPSKSSTKVPNTYVDLNTYGGGVSYVGDSGWGGVAAKHTETSYGSAAESDVHIQLKQTRVDTRGGMDLNAGPFEKLKFAGGWADYKHTEFEGPDPGTTFLSQGYEARVDLVQAKRGGWQGGVGFQGLHRTIDAIGEEALIPKTHINELGAFTLQRLDKDSWGVEGGVRVDTRKLSSSKGDRDFTNLSASIGAFLRPAHGWFLALSGSRTSRAPDEEELFADGPHPATGTYEVGDVSIDQETSYSLDATVHYDAGPWSVDLHAFGVKYDGFIDLQATGAVDAASNLPIYRFVQTSATFYGSEAEGSYEVWKGQSLTVKLEGSGDYVHGDTDLGPPARIPPWSVTGRVVVEGERWDGKLEVRHVAKQTRVSQFELPTDGYDMLNCLVSFHPLKDKDLKIFIDGRNLTDVEAREHASFLKDVAPLPGRSVRVGVGYAF
ncbi:TonB-dependent receptor [Phenylobacterium sp.]|uniref:TonB-dependent receptor n=1 Tax=Phenylobacterium sp. TaxID=1871053 RepID=UPI0035AF96F8